MGDVPKYDPTVPPAAETFKLEDYEMQITKVKEDRTKKSWDRFSFKIDPETRARWLDDPLYGPEWRQLLSDFDSKFLDTT